MVVNMPDNLKKEYKISIINGLEFRDQRLFDHAQLIQLDKDVFEEVVEHCKANNIKLLNKVGDPTSKTIALLSNDPTASALLLFMLDLTDAAWEILISYVDEVEYTKLVTHPAYIVQVTDKSFYSNLYKNGQLSDDEYALYELLCTNQDKKYSNLDMDFWYKRFDKKGCKTFTDVCNVVHNSFNGAFEHLKDDESLSLPRISFQGDLYELMETYLEDNDMLDEFLYEKPAFYFTGEVVMELIETGHFKNIAPMLWVVVNGDGSGINRLWEFLSENNGEDIKNALQTVSILSNEETLFSLLDNIELFTRDKDENDKTNPYVDNLYYLLFNGTIVPKYFNTVDERIDRWFSMVDILKYINPSATHLLSIYKDLGYDIPINKYRFIKYAEYPSAAVIAADGSNTKMYLFNTVYTYESITSMSIWEEYENDPTYQSHSRSELEESILNGPCKGDNIKYNEFMLALIRLMNEHRRMYIQEVANERRIMNG